LQREALAVLGRYHTNRALQFPDKNPKTMMDCFHKGYLYLNGYFKRLELERGECSKPKTIFFYAWSLCYEANDEATFDKALQQMNLYAQTPYANSEGEKELTLALLAGIYKINLTRAYDCGFRDYPQKVFTRFVCGLESGYPADEGNPFVRARFTGIIHVMQNKGIPMIMTG
jgi:hypothetical protein